MDMDVARAGRGGAKGRGGLCSAGHMHKPSDDSGLGLPEPWISTCSAACARVGWGDASDLSVTPPDVEEFIELTALW